MLFPDMARTTVKNRSREVLPAALLFCYDPAGLSQEEDVRENCVRKMSGGKMLRYSSV